MSLFEKAVLSDLKSLQKNCVFSLKLDEGPCSSAHTKLGSSVTTVCCIREIEDLTLTTTRLVFIYFLKCLDFSDKVHISWLFQLICFPGFWQLFSYLKGNQTILEFKINHLLPQSCQCFDIYCNLVQEILNWCFVNFFFVLSVREAFIKKKKKVWHFSH